MAEQKEELETIVNLLKRKKNIILQSAPGTGKTYSTAKIALSLIGLDNIDLSDHSKVMEEYKKLHDSGQIEFVTFHMSMDYEDFIEGIKPEIENNGVTYNVENGIFKRICHLAAVPVSSNFEDAYEKFLKDIAECNEDEPFILKTITGKEFGVCPNTKGNLSLLTGPNKQKNGVLRKNLIEETSKGNENADWYYYNLGVIAYLKNKYDLRISPEFKHKNYILIIDEINRGNISKIFGEYHEAIKLAKLILRRTDFSISDTSLVEHKVPEFTIDMSRIFEFHVLGILRNIKDKDVLFQEKAGIMGRCDYLIPSEQLIVDAKYTPNYPVINNDDKRNKIRNDIREVTGYGRSEHIRRLLNINDDSDIKCLIIYPNEQKKEIDFSNNSILSLAKSFNEIHNFYTLDVPIPLLEDTN